MPIEIRKWIMRKDVRVERDKLFVFGDNLMRFGLGGQAREMRGLPNSVGFPTKNSPAMIESAFLSDADLHKVQTANHDGVDRILKHLSAGGTVVWPEDGLGTGLAQLATRAPKILKYYEDLLLAFKLVGQESHVPELAIDDLRKRVRAGEWGNDLKAWVMWLLAYVDSIEKEGPRPGPRPISQSQARARDELSRYRVGRLAALGAHDYRMVSTHEHYDSNRACMVREVIVERSALSPKPSAEGRNAQQGNADEGKTTGAGEAVVERRMGLDPKTMMPWVEPAEGGVPHLAAQLEPILRPASHYEAWVPPVEHAEEGPD